jgi:hypothetical protein
VHTTNTPDRHNIVYPAAYTMHMSRVATQEYTLSMSGLLRVRGATEHLVFVAHNLEPTLFAQMFEVRYLSVHERVFREVRGSRGS